MFQNVCSFYGLCRHISLSFLIFCLLGFQTCDAASQPQQTTQKPPPSRPPSSRPPPSRPPPSPPSTPFPPPPPPTTIKPTSVKSSPEVYLSDGLIKRNGLTVETCAKACMEEKVIKCQYFKYINSSGTCYLSEVDHPAIKKLLNEPKVKTDEDDAAGASSEPDDTEIAEEESEQHGNTPTRSQFLRNLRYRLAKARIKGQARDRDITKLWNNQLKQHRFLVFLKKVVLMLGIKAGEIQNKLDDVESFQKDLGKHVNNLQESSKELKKGMDSVDSFSSGLKHVMEKVVKIYGSMKQNMQQQEQAGKKLEQKFEELSKDFKKNHDIKSLKEQEEHLKEIQLKMANSLAGVSDRNKNVSNQINALREEMNTVSQQIKDASSKHKSDEAEVIQIREYLKKLENEIQGLEDPKSPVYRRWQADIDNMKNLIVKLTDSNNRLIHEKKRNKQDLASILQDLSNVQITSEDMKIKLDTIRRTTSQLKDNVDELQKSKTQSPDFVQLMRMKSKILSSLIAFEKKEEQTAEQVQDFSKRLQTLENGAEKEDVISIAQLQNLKDGFIRLKSELNRIVEWMKGMKNLQNKSTDQDIDTLREKQKEAVTNQQRLENVMADMIKEMKILQNQNRNVVTAEDFANIKKKWLQSHKLVRNVMDSFKKNGFVLTDKLKNMQLQLETLKRTVEAMAYKKEIETVTKIPSETKTTKKGLIETVTIAKFATAHEETVTKTPSRIKTTTTVPKKITVGKIKMTEVGTKIPATETKTVTKTPSTETATLGKFSTVFDILKESTKATLTKFTSETGPKGKKQIESVTVSKFSTPGGIVTESPNITEIKISKETEPETVIFQKPVTLGKFTTVYETVTETAKKTGRHTKIPTVTEIGTNIPSPIESVTLAKLLTGKGTIVKSSKVTGTVAKIPSETVTLGKLLAGKGTVVESSKAAETVTKFPSETVTLAKLLTGKGTVVKSSKATETVTKFPSETVNLGKLLVGKGTVVESSKATETVIKFPSETVTLGKLLAGKGTVVESSKSAETVTKFPSETVTLAKLLTGKGTVVKSSKATETVTKFPSETVTLGKLLAGKGTVVESSKATETVTKFPSETVTLGKLLAGKGTVVESSKSAETVTKFPSETVTLAKLLTGKGTVVKSSKATETVTKFPSETVTLGKLLAGKGTVVESSKAAETVTKFPSETVTLAKLLTGKGTVVKSSKATETVTKFPSETVTLGKLLAGKGTVVESSKAAETVTKFPNESVTLAKLLTGKGTVVKSSKATETVTKFPSETVTLGKLLAGKGTVVESSKAAETVTKFPSETVTLGKLLGEKGTVVETSEATETVTKFPNETVSLGKFSTLYKTVTETAKGTGRQTKIPTVTEIVTNIPSQTASVTNVASESVTLAKLSTKNRTVVETSKVTETVTKFPSESVTKVPNEVEPVNKILSETVTLGKFSAGNKSTTRIPIQTSPKVTETVKPSFITAAKACKGGFTLVDGISCLKFFTRTETQTIAKADCKLEDAELYSTTSQTSDDLLKYLKISNVGSVAFWISGMKYHRKSSKWLWDSTQKPLTMLPNIKVRDRNKHFCAYGRYKNKRIVWVMKPCASLLSEKKRYVCMSKPQQEEKSEKETRIGTKGHYLKHFRVTRSLNPWSKSLPQWLGPSIRRARSLRQNLVKQLKGNTSRIENAKQDQGQFKIRQRLKRSARQRSHRRTARPNRYNSREARRRRARRRRPRKNRQHSRRGRRRRRRKNRRSRKKSRGRVNRRYPGLSKQHKLYARLFRGLQHGLQKSDFKKKKQRLAELRRNRQFLLKMKKKWKKVEKNCTNSYYKTSTGNCIRAYGPPGTWHFARLKCHGVRAKGYTRDFYKDDSDIPKYLDTLKSKGYDGRFWISDMFYNVGVKRWYWTSTREALNPQPALPTNVKRYCTYGTYHKGTSQPVQWSVIPCSKVRRIKLNFAICERKLSQQNRRNKLRMAELKRNRQIALKMKKKWKKVCTHSYYQTSTGNCIRAYRRASTLYHARLRCQRTRAKQYTRDLYKNDTDIPKYLDTLKRKGYNGRFWISDMFYHIGVKSWFWTSTREEVDPQPALPTNVTRYCTYGTYHRGTSKPVQWSVNPCFKVGRLKLNFAICEKKPSKQYIKSPTRGKKKKQSVRSRTMRLRKYYRNNPLTRIRSKTAWPKTNHRINPLLWRRYSRYYKHKLEHATVKPRTAKPKKNLPIKPKPVTEKSRTAKQKKYHLAKPKKNLPFNRKTWHSYYKYRTKAKPITIIIRPSKNVKYYYGKNDSTTKKKGRKGSGQNNGTKKKKRIISSGFLQSVDYKPKPVKVKSRIASPMMKKKGIIRSGFRQGVNYKPKPVKVKSRTAKSKKYHLIKPKPVTVKSRTAKQKKHRPIKPKPVTEKSRTAKPKKHRPIKPKPVTEKSTTVKPKKHRPIKPKPVSEKSRTAKPKKHRPIKPKPVTEKSKTAKPKKHRPIKPKPVSEKSRTAKPKKHRPIKPKPVSEKSKTAKPKKILLIKPKADTVKSRTAKPKKHRPIKPKPVTEKSKTAKPKKILLIKPKADTVKSRTAKPKKHRPIKPKPVTEKSKTAKPKKHRLIKPKPVTGKSRTAKQKKYHLIKPKPLTEKTRTAKPKKNLPINPRPVTIVFRPSKNVKYYYGKNNSTMKKKGRIGSGKNKGTIKKKGIIRSGKNNSTMKKKGIIRSGKNNSTMKRKGIIRSGFRQDVNHKPKPVKVKSRTARPKKYHRNRRIKSGFRQGLNVKKGCPEDYYNTSSGACLKGYTRRVKSISARSGCQVKKTHIYTKNASSNDAELYEFLKSKNFEGKFWISDMRYRKQDKQWFWGSTNETVEPQPNISANDGRYCIYGTYNEGKPIVWSYNPCSKVGSLRSDFYVCQVKMDEYVKAKEEERHNPTG